MKRIRVYQLASFLSAFLLFLVQPMAAKALLPDFGGSYMVWGTCMVFFQGFLSLGYAYAHAAQKRLGVVRYSRWHWCLLIGACVAWPFHFADLTGPGAGIPVFLSVTWQLVLLVGLPFATLATASPILQRWLSVSNLPERENPYVLYSPSNLGSLSALLLYPVVIEPQFDIETQASIWWGGYGLLLIFFLACMPRRGHADELRDGEPAMAARGVSRRTLTAWFVLSAAGSALLVAVTNVITFDVAAVPFLWVLPLVVYLLTFVLLFKRNMWFPAWIRWALIWAVVLGMLVFMMSEIRFTVPILVELALHLAVLFVVCMNCHGRLVQARPADVRHLTLFYLVMSVGGFAGSLIVNWIVPLVSNSLIEYIIAFILAMVGIGLVSEKEPGTPWISVIVGVVATLVGLIVLPPLLSRGLNLPHIVCFIGAAVPFTLALVQLKARPYAMAVILVAAMVGLTWTEDLMAGASNVRRHRNFYGVYKIYDHNGYRYLKHGTTLHGREYLDPKRRGEPISYYQAETPSGRLMRSTNFEFRTIGMIGLGSGGMVGYADRGDEFTVYELDPEDVEIATNDFYYVDTALARGADVDFVVGDGRLSLATVADNTYDLFIIDAFSSGAIPVHLLTVEAVAEYLRVLKPDGLLLMHVSNKFLNLEPLVAALADELKVTALTQRFDSPSNRDAERCVWMVLTHNGYAVRTLELHLGWYPARRDRKVRIWTDRYSNLLQLLY